jgi:hypothetical protein
LHRDLGCAHIRHQLTSRIELWVCRHFGTSFARSGDYFSAVPFGSPPRYGTKNANPFATDETTASNEQTAVLRFVGRWFSLVDHGDAGKCAWAGWMSGLLFSSVAFHFFSFLFIEQTVHRIAFHFCTVTHREQYISRWGENASLCDLVMPLCTMSKTLL